MNRRLFRLALFLSICANAALLFAQQPHIRTPQVSPAAVVQETFGVTDVSVSYHRPSVNHRKIFGGLVPYDVLWRAGANEPTHITFSTPVKVEGQDVPAGTYSLFLLPGQQEWTLVLSKFTGGWGTYSYDQSEDQLRVKVTPQPIEMTERLVYTFDDAKENSVTLSMRWEKTRVPVKIEADTKALVADGIKRDLRNENYWVPAAWVEAANYMFANGNNDLALQYVDHALVAQPTAQALRLKAAIVEKKGDAEQAKALRAQAEPLMPPDIATISSAYRLMRQKKYDEALTTLGDAKSYRGLAAIGDAWAGKGDKAKAMEWYQKAMSAASNQTERVEVQDNINALGAS